MCEQKAATGEIQERDGCNLQKYCLFRRRVVPRAVAVGCLGVHTNGRATSVLLFELIISVGDQIAKIVSLLVLYMFIHDLNQHSSNEQLKHYRHHLLLSLAKGSASTRAIPHFESVWHRAWSPEQPTAYILHFCVHCDYICDKCAHITRI